MWETQTMRGSDHEHLVLIVEDDPDARSILEELVRDEGYATRTAANGLEALQQLEAAKDGELPCLILLDMMMPVLDGRGFRAAQEVDPVLAEIPVVVVTAHGDATEIARTLRAAGVVRKPIDFDKLLDVIRFHC